MGFGFMFLGCFFFVGVAIFIPDIVGFILVFAGCHYANQHCENYSIVTKLCYPGFLLSVAKLFLSIFSSDINVTVTTVYSGVYTAFLAVFLVMLMKATMQIAIDTGVMKLRSRALTSMIIVPLFLVSKEVLNVLAQEGIFGDNQSKIVGTAMLLSIIAALVCAATMFSAYRLVCVEGDENMDSPGKFKSPFGYYDKKNRK